MSSLSSIVVSFFFLLIFSLPEKVHVCSFYYYFLFNSLCFLLLIFVLGLFQKKFMFLIYSLNHNLSYIIFTNSLFILLISIFFLAILLKFYWFSILSFNQNLCCFIFSNLALILLISFFLLKFFFLFNLTLQFNLFMPSNK